MPGNRPTSAGGGGFRNDHVRCSASLRPGSMLQRDMREPPKGEPVPEPRLAGLKRTDRDGRERKAGARIAPEHTISSTTDPAMAGDLKALFIHHLKDLYFAENAILKALPKMASAAQSDELKGAFGVHLEETKEQVRRLDEVFRSLGQKPEGIECKGIEGLIAEGEEVTSEFQGGEALDAGLIAAAQAVEHYEITRYGTMLAWAKQLQLDRAAGLLQETLIEEENTDEILSELAEDTINPAAQ